MTFSHIRHDKRTTLGVSEKKQREATRGRKGEGGLGGGGGLSAASDVGRRLGNKHPHPNSPSLHLPRPRERVREKASSSKRSHKDTMARPLTG